uniref:Selenocysteine lyase n=1 Tax=Timema shepardi TaxID=629360 RepID=A0A7R9B8X0_TIMSH|nr:unnamed protein product [Timema shepardi]
MQWEVMAAEEHYEPVEEAWKVDDGKQEDTLIVERVTEEHFDEIEFYGPRVGCLYARGAGKATPVYPLLFGGAQERGFRPGTENTPMIAGLGEAARLVCENLDSYYSHMLQMRDYLEEQLKHELGESHVIFNCHGKTVMKLPNTCNVSVVGVGLTGQEILSRCKHIMASTGAACHAQDKPSGEPI